MPIPSNNERAARQLSVTYERIDGEPSTPSTVHWRLTDEATGTIQQDWTAVAIDYDGTDYTSTINIPGSVLTLCNRRNERELKSVLIVANKDEPSGTREASTEYKFYVVRTARE